MPFTGRASDYTNFVRLFSFDGDNGDAPYGDLIEGSDGKLYGTTVQGGITNEAFPVGMGTVYSLNKDGTGYAVLHFFTDDDNDGKSPYGALVEGHLGTLYGTTRNGGKVGKGTIFKLDKNHRRYEVLWHFKGGANDGAHPEAGLLRTWDEPARSRSAEHARNGSWLRLDRANSGVLFGTVSAEGPAGNGAVFRIKESGAGYTVISSLWGDDGWGAAEPAAALVEGSDGALYGTALRGWEPGFNPGLTFNTYGAIFRLNKDGSGLAILNGPFSTFIFPGALSEPRGSLLEGSDGFMYGTTAGGSASRRGCLFRFPREDFRGFVVTHFFGPAGTDGVIPHAGLIEGDDGALYGTTSSGNGEFPVFPLPWGTVFKLNKDGSGFTTLKLFTGVNGDGATPQAKLLLGSDGVIYGTTSSGGDAGHGIIFALSP